MYDQIYSEFEVKNTSIKFNGTEETAEKVGCVGTLEETMKVKTITKKCEGIVTKTVIKGDGTGELKITAHMRYDLFLKSYGMLSDGFKTGVYAYGRDSIHKPLCLTCEVFDEDGVKKYKAYPNCVVSSGMARKIENGAEEVAEMELTLSVMPDELGNGMYEAIDSESLDETLKSKWMTDFNAELVKQVQA